MDESSEHQTTTNLYSFLEKKSDQVELFQLISEEIQRLFALELSRYKGVTTEYNAILKRKNLLEAKLFKRKYEKISKHLSGMSSRDRNLNPFNKLPNPSVVSENIVSKHE